MHSDVAALYLPALCSRRHLMPASARLRVLAASRKRFSCLDNAAGSSMRPPTSSSTLALSRKDRYAKSQKKESALRRVARPTRVLACLSQDVDEAKIEALFTKYKEADEDSIQVTGVMAFCEDLGVDPTDAIMLIISWQMRCATMCVFTREEWMRGMTAMGCESIDQLKAAFDDLR